MKEFSASDLILEGLAYTVMGLLVVFAVLIIIMLVIKAMALFSKEEAPAPEKAMPAPEAAPAQEAEVSSADESELVAVITAAVAAAMQTSPSGLLIRSYKKVSGAAWNNAGRRETLENRF